MARHRLEGEVELGLSSEEPDVTELVVLEAVADGRKQPMKKIAFTHFFG